MMNLVDLVSNQLTGDVIGKLGGLLGTNEQQTRAATSAAVPSLLSVFGKMASTPAGANQLAGAMGGLDLSMLGNLAGMLGGSQASSVESLGGKLLGSLLGGGSSMNLLTSLLGSFLKSSPGMTKSLLSYLTPVVLGMIAKQFTGRPDAAGVQRLFSEQSSNIARAVPQGLSLGNVLSALDTSGGRPVEPARGGSYESRETHRQETHGRASHGHETASSGMPGWLLPLLLLAGLGAALWFFRGRGKEELAKAPERAAVAVREEAVRVGDTIVDRTDVIERVGDQLRGIEIDEVFKLPAGLGEATDVVKGLSGMFGDMTRTFEGITDEASARAALPRFEAFAPQLETFQTETGELPEASRSLVADFVGKGLKVLGPLVETAMAIPGVRDILGPVVGPLVETMSKLAK
jgi:hypothetical protein